jgi:hypothetical protein
LLFIREEKGSRWMARYSDVASMASCHARYGVGLRRVKVEGKGDAYRFRKMGWASKVGCLGEEERELGCPWLGCKLGLGHRMC